MLPMIVLKSSSFLPHNTMRVELEQDMANELLGRLNDKDKRSKQLAVFSSTDVEVKGGMRVSLSREDVQILAAGTIAELQGNANMDTSDAKTVSLLLKGLQRCSFVKECDAPPSSSVPMVTVRPYQLTEDASTADEIKRLHRRLRAQAMMMFLRSPELRTPQLSKALEDAKPSQLADLVAQALDDKDYLPDKLSILAAKTVHEQLTLTLSLLVKQRAAALADPLKGLSGLFGGGGNEEDDLAELKDKVSKMTLPEIVSQTAQKELRRLAKMPSSSAEYSVARTYVEALLDMPWGKTVGTEPINMQRVSDVLEQEHHGLASIKQRILQFVAVIILHQQQAQQQLVNSKKGSPTILCFVGPPGVGKTSLGKCIAAALGRPFERIALGGVYDEAELRGHRRTYVGALPGNIVQALRKAGSINPVILLDEIDKIGARHGGRHGGGDPQAALLEVLDPDQNSTFQDHYLALPMDLSQVIFLATANSTESISPPLLDRMEVIHLTGYTANEKLQIAKKHLISKTIQAAGLSSASVQLHFQDDGLRDIIAGHTREAGVRQLERQIASICRHVAVDVVQHGAKGPISIDQAYVSKVLGAAKHSAEAALATAPPGVVTGMAWTPTGGDLLFVEAVAITMPLFSEHPHNPAGTVSITGNVGKVMEESCQIALGWIRANWTTVLDTL